MGKYYIYILMFFLFIPFMAFADGEMEYKILKISDRVFYNTNKPTIKVAIYNKGEEKHTGSVVCRVEPTTGEHVFDFGQEFLVAPSDSSFLSFTFALEKGFYKVSLLADGQQKERVVMAYEPEMIGSGADTSFNGKDYYANVLQQLERQQLYALVEKVKKSGGKMREAYKVNIRSIGGRYFEGYYLYPKKRGIYPVVITCADKNETLEMPAIDSYPDRIDFVITTRKSLIRNEDYYKGSYIDIMRAIDFVYSRKEADLKNIFLQGNGCGGAMVLAAAALDKRVAGVSVYAPGYSDESAVEGSKPYEVKNVSENIECPVLMGVGLEDTVCPPADNFEIYNPIKGTKEYYIFIEGHYPPAEWKEITDNFYMKHKR